MGVEVTTAVLGRLWQILEAGETAALCKVGNRIKYASRQGWLKEAMAKGPADFPQVEIEVGSDSTHSAWTKAPTYEIEGAAYAGAVLDFEIDRTEQVVITVTTDRVDVGGVNPTVEAVIDDVMRSGPRLGLSPPVVGFSGFRSRQRRVRQPNRRDSYKYITTITFRVDCLQNGKLTLTGQE